MKAWILSFSILLCSMLCSAQINVALLHQLIENSKSEHSRQTSLRDKQGISTSIEGLNASQSGRLKSVYQDLRKKFSAVGMAIESLQISTQALPLLKQISADQLAIVSLCSQKPALALLAVDTQVDLVDRSQLLLRYIYGLALSTGELGAMSRSDRAMLISFVLGELRGISVILSGLKVSLMALDAMSERPEAGFSNMLDRDLKLSENILLKVKQLKKK